MKRILLLLLVTCTLNTVLRSQATIKDPNAQVREAKNFTSIHLSSAFDVYLSQGDEESVAVSAAETKYMEDIIVEVKNGVLEINYKPKNWKWNSGNRKLKAYISFKQVNKLTVSGACDVDIIGTWTADELKINLSGASDLSGKLDAKQLDVDISGASDIKISGTVAQMTVEASGASSFKGFDMTADYCNAKASGASDIKISVTKELSVHASGASDIHYKGTGVIRDLKTSGASSVSRSGS